MKKMIGSKTEKAFKVLAWLEFAFSLLSVIACIYGLVIVSQNVSESSAAAKKMQYQLESMRSIINNDNVNNNRSSTSLVVLTPDSNKAAPAKTILPTQYLGFIAIKVTYFVILFCLMEAAVALFCIRSINQRNLAQLKSWLIFIAIITVLYITDFISTLHAVSIMEDFSVSLGIFIKVPLLIVGYKYYQQLSEHGENLVNESPL